MDYQRPQGWPVSLTIVISWRPRGGEWQATTVLQLLAQSRVQAVSGPVLGLQTMTIQFTGVDVSWTIPL
jgi:hypothetical protein